MPRSILFTQRRPTTTRAIHLANHPTPNRRRELGRLWSGVLSGVFCGVLGSGGLFGCKAPLNPLGALSVGIIASPRPPENVQVNFCTDPPQKEIIQVKYLFLIDHSGSNSQNLIIDQCTGFVETNFNPRGSGVPAGSNCELNPQNNQFCTVQPPTAVPPQCPSIQPTPCPTVGCSPVAAINSYVLPNPDNNLYATDPKGTFRYPSIIEFVQAVQSSSFAKNTAFALIDFSSSVSTYPSSGGTQPGATLGFETNLSNFICQLQADQMGISPFPPTVVCPPQFQALNPGGGSTDYIGALQAAQQIITADIPTLTQPTDYVLIFISDGAPIVGFSNGNGFQPLFANYESQTQINGIIQQLIDLKKNSGTYLDNINLFTYYYFAAGNKDLQGQALLKSMAQTGLGLSYDLNSGEKLDFSQFLPTARNVSKSLLNVTVTNKNVSYWQGPPLSAATQGQPLLDSDGDGIPDSVEVLLGSDPFQADSDGNGVSDLVEYRLNGSPCAGLSQGAGCAQAAATHYQTLSKPNVPNCAALTPLPSASPGGPLIFADTDHDGLNDCEETLLGNHAGINNPSSNGSNLSDWLLFKNNVNFQTGTQPAITVPDASGKSIFDLIRANLPVGIPYQEIIHPQPALYALQTISSSLTQSCFQLNVSNLPTIGPNNQVMVEVMLSDSLGKLHYRKGLKAFAGNSLVLKFNDWNDQAEKTLGTWTQWDQP